MSVNLKIFASDSVHCILQRGSKATNPTGLVNMLLALVFLLATLLREGNKIAHALLSNMYMVACTHMYMHIHRSPKEQ